MVVAVATAFGAAAWLRGERPDPGAVLDAVRRYLVDGEVARGVRRTRELLRRSAGEAAYALGNGARVTAGDTVPFTLWCAAQFLDDYPAAAFTGRGDRPGVRGVPPHWIANREPLPAWAAVPDPR